MESLQGGMKDMGWGLIYVVYRQNMYIDGFRRTDILTEIHTDEQSHYKRPLDLRILQLKCGDFYP